VSQYLRLSPSGKGQPLLVDLVTSVKNPASAPYFSPAQSPHSTYPQSPRASDPPASPRSPRAQPTHWPTKTNPHAPTSSSSTPTNSPTIKKLAIPLVNVPVQPLQPLPTTTTKTQQPQLASLSIAHPQSSLPQPQAVSPSLIQIPIFRKIFDFRFCFLILDLDFWFLVFGFWFLVFGF
jgi:hypothetical protein